MAESGFNKDDIYKLTVDAKITTDLMEIGWNDPINCK